MFCFFLKKLILPGNAILLPCCCVAVLLITGCTPNGNHAETDDPSTPSARAKLERKRTCSRNFQSVHQVLRPSRENINTELQSALSLLNQWFASCAELSDQQLSAEESAIKNSFSKQQVESLDSNTASLLDILYLRDQLLMRNMMQHIVEAVPTDIEKIRIIFDFTQRNITYDQAPIDPRLFSFLQTDFPNEVPKGKLSELSFPRTLQDVFLAGRGSQEDLTWAFASLIRQLNFDAVMVSPVQKENEKPIPPIVLVQVDQKILAFCPAAGLEFLSDNKANLFTWSVEELAQDFHKLFKPTVASQAKQQTVLLRMNNADWKKVNLTMPYSLLRVSPRAEAMQMELAGELSCDVFKPLHTFNSEQGLMENASYATKTIFPDSSLTLWDYPYEMYEGVANATDATNQLLGLYHATLHKTVQSIRTNLDQSNHRSIKKSQVKRMQMSRVDQVLGQESQAIATYMKLRLQRGVIDDGTKNAARENFMRALQVEDSMYWSAVCQYETGAYRTAFNTLIAYLKKYPEGRWKNAALELLADSQVKRKQYQSAIETLKQIELPAPRRARQLLKLKQWKTELEK